MADSLAAELGELRDAENRVCPLRSFSGLVLSVTCHSTIGLSFSYTRRSRSSLRLENYGIHLNNS
jgi:hypothetical protein